MTDLSHRYWVCRTDRRYKEFIFDQLSKPDDPGRGELRQGWGQTDQQNLRRSDVEPGAARNLRMLTVKEGDRILLPHLPKEGLVGIAMATCDWETGYSYADYSSTNDHRHVFPAKWIKSFHRRAAGISGDLRQTLRTPSRFWNIDHLGEEVEQLIAGPNEKLGTKIELETRIENVWRDLFDEIFPDMAASVSDAVFEKLNKRFQSGEWEWLLVEAIQRLMPHCQVERVGGGRAENRHGMDIQISAPGVFSDTSYVIAVQVKDYSNTTGSSALRQIQKAEAYFAADENVRLIEKWVIFTNVKRGDAGSDYDKDLTTRVFYQGDVKRLMTSAFFNGLPDYFDSRS